MKCVISVDSEKIITYLKNKEIISDVILRSNKLVYDYIIKFSETYPEKFVPGGVSIKKEVAIKKALGEAMETYAATLFEGLPEIQSGAKKIIDIYDFLQLKQETNNDGFYSEFDDSNSIKWIKGKSLSNNKNVLIPGFCIFLNYNRFHKRYYPSFSQGLGNSINLKDSVIHGILENIEADSSMIFWRNKLDLPLIKLATLKNHKLNKLIDLLKKENTEIKLIYAKLDIPVNIVICCLFYDDYPHTSFGFGSGQNIEQASLKAIEEALLVKNTLFLLKRQNYGISMKEQEIMSFLDHAVYTSYNLRIVNWITRLKEDKIMPIKQKITLEYLKKELYKKNMNCYYVDLTKKIFQKVGFHQSKTIIPQFCQRDINNNYQFLNNDRLFEVPVELGYTARRNYDPHPFA